MTQLLFCPGSQGQGEQAAWGPGLRQKQPWTGCPWTPARAGATVAATLAVSTSAPDSRYRELWHSPGRALAEVEGPLAGVVLAASESSSTTSHSKRGGK